MPTPSLNTRMLASPEEGARYDQAYMAAAAYLARYSGQTLRTYSHDLRYYFNWCAEVGSLCSRRRGPTSSSTAPPWRRGAWPPRLSTICGFYRFAHIDGRISSNPAEYVRRPKVHPSAGRGLDRGELATFLFAAERYDRDHAALGVLLGRNGLRVGRP